jgi:hypothetical protein
MMASMNKHLIFVLLLVSPAVAAQTLGDRSSALTITVTVPDLPPVVKVLLASATSSANIGTTQQGVAVTAPPATPVTVELGAQTVALAPGATVQLQGAGVLTINY